MKYILVFMWCIIGVQAFAQGDAPFKQHPVLPDFQLRLLDSTMYFRSKLPAGKPVVLVYFSPECGHCQNEAKALADSIALVDKAVYLWVSFHPLPAIAAFAKQYQLAGRSQVIFGRDEAYHLPSYFKVRYLPFVVVFNAQHRIVQVYEGGAYVKEIAEQLQHLP